MLGAMRRLLILMLVATSAHAECALDAVEVAAEDLDAAHEALRAVRRRPACRLDPLVIYNLGYVRDALSRRDGDPVMACQAAETYTTYLELETDTEAAAAARSRVRALRPSCVRPDPAAPWRVATLVTTLSVGVAAASFGGVALGAAQEARDADDSSAYDDHLARAEAFGRASDVAWGFAAVAGAVTLWLWLRDPPPPLRPGID